MWTRAEMRKVIKRYELDVALIAERVKMKPAELEKFLSEPAGDLERLLRRMYLATWEAYNKKFPAGLTNAHLQRGEHSETSSSDQASDGSGRGARRRGGSSGDRGRDQTE